VKPDNATLELIKDVRAEAALTGRKPLEILQALRDEGYIEGYDDDDLNELAAAATLNIHKRGET